MLLLFELWQLRARCTLLDVVQSISHTKSDCFSTCFIDSVIFYLFPMLSHVFRYFFIISSSVLEQAGFSKIESVISSNPTWQCLYFVCFLHSYENSRACQKYLSFFWVSHWCVNLRSRLSIALQHKTKTELQHWCPERHKTSM